MEAPPLERKLVAILAADVASYSRLMEIDEEGTLATLSAFRLVTDRLISRHEGRICGTAGDSILAAFGSALAAVQCAVEIQNELAHENNDLEKDRRMQFRIGINVGDVMLKDGDIFGDGVNIAARLEGLADPGGVCISRGIHDHVMKKLPFEFEDLGEQTVKNIAQPVRVYRLLLDERPSESRSSPASTPSPDGEADIPSLSEDEPDAPASDPQAVEIEFWDSIKNSILASEYEAYPQQLRLRRPVLIRGAGRLPRFKSQTANSVWRTAAAQTPHLRGRRRRSNEKHRPLSWVIRDGVASDASQFIGP
jgi:adenylate cyclase